MAFIGNTNTTQAFTPAIDYFSGTGSATAFTLSRPVASVAQVQVTIDNVAQNPSSAYTVSGNTITFTSAPLSGTNNIYVYYTSPITQVIAPGQGTVNTNSLTSSLSLTTPTLVTPNITTGLTIAGSAGTSGQVVTSAGSGAAPTWATITGVPAGNVSFFAMNTAPSGWLKANGTAVSRTTYATLFTAIGTTFGVGDGSTTFNVPDMRGYFARGWVDNGTIDSGRAFGSTQADEFKSHTHTEAVAGRIYQGAGAFLYGGSTGTSGATGGTETRPYNVALLACIKT
jgi:hypothetical protein